MALPIIEITYEFEVPVARLFEAWTNPRDMNAWVWGGMGREPHTTVDLSVGGWYDCAITVEEADGWHSNRLHMTGLYAEIVPNERLVYTVHWDAPVGYNQVPDQSPVDELVFATFHAIDERRSKLVYAHHGVPDEAAAREHKKAIRFTFDCLARHLQSEAG